jgi:hypothetical protein
MKRLCTPVRPAGTIFKPNSFVCTFLTQADGGIFPATRRQASADVVMIIRPHRFLPGWRSSRPYPSQLACTEGRGARNFEKQRYDSEIHQGCMLNVERERFQQPNPSGSTDTTFVFLFRLRRFITPLFLQPSGCSFLYSRAPRNEHPWMVMRNLPYLTMRISTYLLRALCKGALFSSRILGSLKRNEGNEW